MNLDAGTLN